MLYYTVLYYIILYCIILIICQNKSWHMHMLQLQMAMCSLWWWWQGTEQITSVENDPFGSGLKIKSTVSKKVMCWEISQSHGWEVKCFWYSQALRLDTTHWPFCNLDNLESCSSEKWHQCINLKHIKIWLHTGLNWNFMDQHMTQFVE